MQYIMDSHLVIKIHKRIKTISYTLLVFLVQFSFCHKSEYDTAIIGGGLSGLSAAYKLKDNKNILIEKQGYLGGRVLTKKKQGVIYEMGALFNFPHELMPFKTIIRDTNIKDNIIGILYNDTMQFCDFMMDCVERLNISAKDKGLIRSFVIDPINNINKLSTNTYSILNAFFRSIHPSEMKNYWLTEKNSLLFTKLPTDFNPEGNASIIQSLVKNSGVEIELNAEVILIEEEFNKVVIKYNSRNNMKQVIAKTAIVATDAITANKITSVFVFKRKKIPLFSYVVSNQLSPHVIYQNIKAENSILTMYFGNNESIALRLESSEVIYNKTYDALRKYNLFNFDHKDIEFSDNHFWDPLGTLITKNSFNRISPDTYKAGKRVYLAGDYLMWDNSNPYGMREAILSGYQAASAVNNYLLEGNINEK